MPEAGNRSHKDDAVERAVMATDRI